MLARNELSSFADRQGLELVGDLALVRVKPFGPVSV